MRKDNLLFWSVTALFLVANVTNLLLKQEWTSYMMAVCTAVYLTGILASLMLSDRHFKRTMQAHKRNDELFWATLENIRMVGESDMAWEDKEQALLYLREQYRKAVEQESL